MPRSKSVKELDVGPALLKGDRVVGSGKNLVVAIVANRTIFTIYLKQLIRPIYRYRSTDRPIKRVQRMQVSGRILYLGSAFILSRQKGTYSLHPRTAAPTPHLSLSR